MNRLSTSPSAFCSDTGLSSCDSDVSMQSVLSTSSSDSDTGSSYADDSEADDADPEFSVFPREWHRTDGASIWDDGMFTVATYNILTDNMIREGEYLYCSPKVRYMETRHPKIMAEVEVMDADVICMQEVDADNFQCRLQRDMTTLGYQGLFHLKDRHLDDKQSIAIFYKRDVFHLVEQKHCVVHNLADSSIQMASCSDTMKETIRDKIRRPVATMMVKLQHLTTGQVVSVGNVHITWEKLHHPALQALQVSMANRELVQFAGGPNQPHILCGDFNTPPEYPAYKMLTDGCMGTRARESLNKHSDKALPGNEIPARELADLLPPCAFQSRSQLKSAYKTVMGREPEITNSDSPQKEGRCELCLDYLWYSHQSLDVTGVLATPPKDAILKHFSLPSVLFPSDHIPLKAQFAFK